MTDIANFNDLDTGPIIKINIAEFSVPTIDFAPNRTWTDADLPDADLPKFSETDLPTLIADPLTQFYNTTTTKQSNSSALPVINEAFLPDTQTT